MLNFFLPALAFNLISSAQIDKSFLAIPVTAALVTLAAWRRLTSCTAGSPGSRDRPPGLRRHDPCGRFRQCDLPGPPGDHRHARRAIRLRGYPLRSAGGNADPADLGVFAAARYGSGRTCRSGVAPAGAQAPAALGRWPPEASCRCLASRSRRWCRTRPALMGRAVIPVMTFTVGLALDFRTSGGCRSPCRRSLLKLVLAPVLACGSVRGWATASAPGRDDRRRHAGDGALARDRR